MRPTILLFDIDGTLITTGGVGRQAMESAFLIVHGRRDAIATFGLDGMTDRAIVRMGLQTIGAPDDEGAIDRVLDRYLDFLQIMVAKASSDSYRLHPGMAEVVSAAQQAGMGVGLGTGNVREGARLKLQRVGVFQHFRFGGFGDDHEDRATLIRRGAERGAQHLKVDLADARVVVIGDTPRDVAAAVAIGAECIGVATGSYSTDQLLRAGATRAFLNLAEDGAALAVLGQ